MGGFQLMQILGLLGIYFDAVVVEVKTFLLLFRLALAILCGLGKTVSGSNSSAGMSHNCTDFYFSGINWKFLLNNFQGF
jgi:hypothetical protein